MPRLVVVSNRVPALNEESDSGGLVTALKPALEERGGIWFGWSGETAADPAQRPRLASCNGFTLATLDLSEAELEGYYNRLANQALWPGFHRRLDLVTAHDDAAYATYRAVNRRFAEALRPLLEPDDTIWVQDYHLIPLGEELRRLGVASPIGFFLHTPFPSPEMFAALPWSRELARTFAAYDLIGFQRRSCAGNFLAYMREYRLAAASDDGWSDDGWLFMNGRSVRVEAHPIGIDTARFASLAGSPEVIKKAGQIRSFLGPRLGIAGVERLDYTKGIVQRFHALETLFDRHPNFLDRITMFQVAAPSRLSVPEYQAIQAELETLSGQINARLGTLLWSPLHYRNQAFGQSDVAALLRACRVGLVTPLRDGMNLVAKEYVAAQSPSDPGVLVLSCFAGAADQLTEALIVNPYNTTAMAEALRTALEMPRDERRERWHRTMRRLKDEDVHQWQRGFLASLASARERNAAYAQSAA